MAERTVTPVGDGVYRIRDGVRSRLAYAVANGDARWVFLEGHVYVIDADHGGAEVLPHEPSSAAGGAAQPARSVRTRSRSHDTGALAAPMPATVVRIIVEPGQRVSTGDVLVMLEAMKMELPIKAPRDATVKTIACRPGDLVQPGVPLVELE